MNARRTILRLLSTVLVSCLVISCSKKSDTFIPVAADDSEMAAAIEKARTSLPDFWKVFDRPEHGESDFSLKVKITGNDRTEHFWLTDLERKDGKLFGLIGNDPEYVKTVKFGQRIEINEADISDWLYIRDQKMHGNFTVRALFKSMPADQVNQIKSKMADP